MAGILLSVWASGILDYRAIVAGLILSLLQASGQVTNQIVDRELDKIVKPYRPLARGDVSVSTAVALDMVIIIVSLLLMLLLESRLPIMLALMIMLFALGYNTRTVRCNLVLNIMFTSISRGLLPPLFVYSIFRPIDSTALSTAIVCFTWVLSLQPTKDILDVEGDRMFGYRTLPAVLGVDRSIRLMKLMLVLLYTPACIVCGTFYTPLVFLSVLAVPGLVTLKYAYTRFSENNIAWICFYLGLCTIYLVLSIHQLLII